MVENQSPLPVYKLRHFEFVTLFFLLTLSCCLSSGYFLSCGISIRLLKYRYAYPCSIMWRIVIHPYLNGPLIVPKSPRKMIEIYRNVFYRSFSLPPIYNFIDILKCSCGCSLFYRFSNFRFEHFRCIFWLV